MDLITKLYRDNFTKVLSDWCHVHGVLYLGHTIEDNGAHARLGYGTGSLLPGQETMDYAGIDVIGGQVVPGMNYHMMPLIQGVATENSIIMHLRNWLLPQRIWIR